MKLMDKYRALSEREQRLVMEEEEELLARGQQLEAILGRRLRRRVSIDRALG